MSALALSIVCCFAAAHPLYAAVALGTPFSDGAVLQRGVNVLVWGRATPGNVVTVAFAGQERTAKTGAARDVRKCIH